MSTPKQRYLMGLLVAAALFVSIPLLIWAFPSNPPLGVTGAPGDGGTCANCHSGGHGGGSLSIAFAGGGTTYTPGTARTITVTVNDPNGSSTFGFEMTALNGSTSASATPAGTSFTPVSANVSAAATSGSRLYERQSADTTNTFSFIWTPPASSVYNGPVTFYAAGLAGNGSQGAADSIYTTAVTLTSAAAGPTLTAAPTSLTFNYTQGGSVPSAQSISLTSSGTAISYNVAAAATSGGSWLSATPASGTTPGTESVSLNSTTLSTLAAGTYQGTVTFTATTTGVTNSPVSVPVTLNVTAALNLTVTPTSLTFNAAVGGIPASQTVSVGSSGSVLTYTVTTSVTTPAGGSWLAAAPASSTTPGTETISVNTTGLAAGTYTGSVRIASTGARNSPQTVAVTLNVTATPSLTLTPTGLTFNAAVGATPASQTVSIGSTGAALNYTVTTSVTTPAGGTWLAATPASSTTPGTETVSVNTTGLAAGIYTGSVRIASSTAGNSPQTVAVTLNVSAVNFTVTPSALTFNFQTGSTTPASQTFSVGSTGSALGFSVTIATTSGGNWLSATPNSATTPATETVTVNPSGLAAGTYTGTVSAGSSAAGNSPQRVAVTVNVSAAGSGTLTVTPTALTFSVPMGSGSPGGRSVSVGSSGTALNYSVTTSTTSGGNWLTATPASGTTPGSESVSVHPSGLAVGTYTGTVRIAPTNAGNSPQLVAITLIVTQPRLTTSPGNLTFYYEAGGPVPAAQNVSVDNSGTALNYNVAVSTTSGGSWLAATPTGGTTPGTESVSVNPSNLAVGNYTGHVTISSSGASNSPRTVGVTLAVSPLQYRLTGWSELGMHCIDGKDYSIWSVLPPYNVIRAQLVTLTDPPQPITSGVTITYQALADSTGSINTISSTKSNFWSPSPLRKAPTYDSLLFPNLITDHLNILGAGEYVVGRVNPPKDIGLTNNPVQSLTPHPMNYNSTFGYWEATGVPTIPYDDTGAFKPYPMAQLTARNSAGTTVATAQIVLAVSDELKCSTCHASNSDPAAMPRAGWVNNSDPNKDMKLNVLRKHDDHHFISGLLPQLAAMGYHYQSTLEATARGGTPVLCGACHEQHALELDGLPGVNSLTEDMHQFHGPQINPTTNTSLDMESVSASSPNTSCYLCHPGVNTQCERGAMSSLPPNSCNSCHGNIAGTAGNIGPYVGESTRVGWLTLPACQMCHQGVLQSSTYSSTPVLVGSRYFTTVDSKTDQWRTTTDPTFATNQNVPLSGFQLYRYSKGHGSLNCSACHGSPHAEFPSTQANDNVYSINLQGYAGVIRECGTCHNPVPLTQAGGPHGMHTIGQTWVSSHRQFARGNQQYCQYCHGENYQGTVLSQLKVAKTFNAGDFGTKTFSAGHEISCFDCHNGPNGGDD